MFRVCVFMAASTTHTHWKFDIYELLAFVWVWRRTQKLISFQRLKLSKLQRQANPILSHQRVKGRGFLHFSIPHSVCTCT